MLIKHLVNFAGIDVLATPDYHVRLSIDDIEKAVVVPVSDVARVKPSVSECVCGCGLVLVVPLEDVLTSEHYLAQFPVRHLDVVLLKHLHLVSDGHAAGTGAAPRVRRVEG